MLSKIHTLTEKLTAATAPIFAEHRTYDDILAAMCLLMARVVQASPDKGNEFVVLDNAHHQIAHALSEFLKLEAQAANAKAAERDRLKSAVEAGIAGFGALAPVNGHEPGPALVGDAPSAMEKVSDESLKSVINALHKTFCEPSQENENDVASAVEETEQEGFYPPPGPHPGPFNPDGPRSYTQGT